MVLVMKALSRHQRLVIVAMLVLGQGLAVGFGPPRLAARDLDSASLWPRQTLQLGRMSPPQLQAASALLLDGATRTRLYDKDGDRRRAPASTTKMMTALVALARGNLDDTVIVQASDLVVGSASGLRAGEVWKLEDLLYVLLLPSDNAAAVVIARHVAGSEAAFVDLMNAQAAEWGLQGTHFVNSHGLDDPQHYSTAADLAEIARRGLAQPVFARIVNTRERQANGRRLWNLNELLGSYAGARGVKTGTTDEAGECLVSMAQRPDGWAVCVILGSGDRYKDSRLLLDYYFASYCAVPLTLGPPGLNRVRNLDGTEAILVMRGQPTALLPRWQLPWLHVQRLSLPVRAAGADAPVGAARFSLGAGALAEQPLYLAAP